MKQNQRLKEVRKLLNLTQESLAAKIGIKQGSYSDVERGRSSVSPFITLALEKYFNVNPEWIREGTGEVFIKESYRDKQDYRAIDAPATSPDSLKHSPIIRYYDMEITAKDMEAFSGDGPFKEVIVPGFTDCDIAINVWGDSMEPYLTSGQIILLKEWRESFIEYGQIYVIVTKRAHKMVKVIYPGREEDTIMCISKNEIYPPIEIRLDDIDILYLVKGTIARKSI